MVEGESWPSLCTVPNPSSKTSNVSLGTKQNKSSTLFLCSIPVPYISSSVQGKLAIRAVLLNDAALLESLIASVDRVCSVMLDGFSFRSPSSLCSRFTSDVISPLASAAIHYAVKIDNIDLLRILLQRFKIPEERSMSFSSSDAGETEYRKVDHHRLRWSMVFPLRFSISVVQVFEHLDFEQHRSWPVGERVKATMHLNKVTARCCCCFSARVDSM